MINALLILSGVAVTYSAVSVIKNGGEILSELNVGMRNKNMILGKEKVDKSEREVTNDDRINNLGKAVRSRG